ncbi:MAG: hypothetical protein HQL07_00220 [Nitrospirae bacterium]|nr:hypothetical protein [Magnetococcales bacterium]
MDIINKMYRLKFMLSIFIMVLVVYGCVTPVIEDPQDVQEDDITRVTPDSAGVPVWTVGERWEYSDGYALEVESVSKEDGTLRGDHEPYPPENTLTRFKVTLPGESSMEFREDSWIVCKGFFKVESNFSGEHRKNVFVSEKPDQLFPLSVGKSVTYDREFLRNGKLIKHRSSWQVIDYQPKVTISNHDYGCWILEWQTDSLQSDWSGHETWWYCPEINNYARMEYRYGENETSSRVLIKYSHPNKHDQ